MTEWQLIESAPKDGTWVLAFDAGYGRSADELPVVIVAWSGRDPEYPWMESSGLQSFGASILSHWMPLPAPPDLTPSSSPLPIRSEIDL